MPVSLKEYLAAAQQAEQQGRHREASAKYAALGIYLLKKSRAQEARLFLNRAAQLTPRSARVYIQLALCDMALGDESSARAAMENFAKYVVRKKHLTEYREYLETNLKTFPRLRQVFYDAILQLDRTNAEPFLWHADASIEANDFRLAKKMLVKALMTKTHREEVLTRLRKVLEDLKAGEELRALDAHEKGELSLDDCVLLLSGKSPEQSVPPVLPSAELSLSEMSSEDKDLDTLIKDIEHELGIAIEEKHEDVRPLVREFRRRSDAVISSDSKTRIDLAAAFFEMGLTQDAREELGRIDDGDPLYLEAQLLIADVLFREESYLGALDIVQQCLRHRDMTESLSLEAQYKLVLTYQRLGDCRQALCHGIELMKKAPDYRDIRNLVHLLERSAS